MAKDQSEHPHKGPGSRERGLPNCPNMMGQGNDPVPPTSMAWPVAVSDDEQPTPRRKSISGTY